MKILSRLSTLIVFFSLFTLSTVFAVEPVTTKTTTANPNIDSGAPILIADVNIKDAKIVTQDGNIFKISFALTNAEGVQTGVKYGVKIFTQDDKGNPKTAVDEKIYDEVITLPSNSTVNKELEYTAPSTFNGKYSLVIFSNNNNGFPLALSNLGTVTLKGTSRGLEIQPESCNLTINRDKTKYKILESRSIKAEDTLYINCQVVNLSDKSVSATPIFETRVGSSYGNVVFSTGGDTTAINFKGLEKKDISVLIPTKSLNSQNYSAGFALKYGEDVSNPINFVYSIAGEKATIYHIGLDKDTYKDGDVAKLSAVFNLFKSLAPTEGTAPTKYYLNATVADSKDIKCGQQVSKEIDQTYNIQLDFPINNSCLEARVFATITNDKGIVLSQIGTEPKSKIQGLLPATGLSKYIIISIIIFALIALLIIYLKKKKNGTVSSSNDNSSSGVGTMSVFLLILSATFLGSFLSATKASAATYLIFMDSKGSYPAEMIMNLDKTTYTPGSTITMSGYINDLVTPLGGGGIDPFYSLTATQTSSGITKDFGVNPTNLRSVTFTAPATLGNNTITFKYGHSCGVTGNTPSGKSEKRISPVDGACYNPQDLVAVVGDSASNGVRSKKFDIRDASISSVGIANGDKFSMSLYGKFENEYTAIVGCFACYKDDARTITSTLSRDFNLVTHAQWDAYWFAQDGTTPIPMYPTSFVDGTGLLNTTTSAKYGPSVVVTNLTDAWYYNSSLLNYTVVPLPPPPPTATIYINGIQGDQAVNAGPENATVYWISQNATHCACTYDNPSTNNSCGTGISPSLGGKVYAVGSPFTLKETKTISVTCDNS